MAKIVTEWQTFTAPIDAAVGWSEMKKWLGGLEERLPNQAVYVIRTTRPFSISYPKRASPVLYIGEGDFRQRFRDHMKKWIVEFSNSLPNLQIEVRYCQVKVKGNSTAYKDVEADLIWEFGEIYGSAPMMNKQFEYHPRQHIYNSSFFNVLSPGKGKGYKWALTPLASNMSYQSYLKAKF